MIDVHIYSNSEKWKTTVTSLAWTLAFCRIEHSGGKWRWLAAACQPTFKYLDTLYIGLVKYIYSEKASKFCKISTVDLFYVYSACQIYVEDFVKFCDLLGIHELYIQMNHPDSTLL